MQVGHRVHQGQGKAPADVRMLAHRLRQRGAHDLAAAALHHEEVGPQHRGVVAEDVGARRPIEVGPQVPEHLVLPLHVVGARGQLAHRRPAEDELVRPADAQQVGEVRRAVGELQDRQRALGARETLLQARQEPGFEPCTVQLLAGTDGSELGNDIGTHVTVSIIRAEDPA